MSNSHDMPLHWGIEKGEEEEKTVFLSNLTLPSFFSFSFNNFSAQHRKDDF